MTAILSYPEGRGQTKDHQAKPKIQALNPVWARRNLLERHDLHGERADHDEPRRHRREHAHFTACEDRYRGYKRTPSGDNRNLEAIHASFLPEPTRQQLAAQLQESYRSL